MAEKLTDEQIRAKAEELKEKHKVEVHPMVFIIPETGEQIVGYFTEPNRVTKIRVMDKGLISPMSAAAELMEVVLLKEESDPRIYNEDPANDKIYMGAVMECYNTVQLAVNQFKKK